MLVKERNKIIFLDTTSFQQSGTMPKSKKIARSSLKRELLPERYLRLSMQLPMKMKHPG